MSRRLYRLAIWLHPARFRERFGEQMLCIFDESNFGERPQLLTDCFFSLVRQWLIRSDAWKLGAGIAVSGLLLVGWAYSLTRDVYWLPRRGLDMQFKLDPPRRGSVLDESEFSREAAQAVAILARIRQAEKKRKQGHPASAPAPGLGHSRGIPAKES